MNKNDLECGQKQPSKVPNALETVLGALSHYEEGFSTKSFLSYLSFFSLLVRNDHCRLFCLFVCTIMRYNSYLARSGVY